MHSARVQLAWFLPMDDFNALHAASLDDVRGINPWTPVVAPIAPGFIRVFADVVAMAASDLEFVQLFAPDFFLRMGGQAHAFTKGSTQTRPYTHVEGARNHLRYTLHETGVI